MLFSCGNGIPDLVNMKNFLAALLTEKWKNCKFFQARLAPWHIAIPATPTLDIVPHLLLLEILPQRETTTCPSLAETTAGYCPYTSSDSRFAFLANFFISMLFLFFYLLKAENAFFSVSVSACSMTLVIFPFCLAAWSCMPLISRNENLPSSAILRHSTQNFRF